MMKFKWLVIVFTLFTQFVFAETVSNDQKQIKELIKKLYSYTAEEFEAGEFNGKYLPMKRCELYESFFTSELLKNKKKPHGCITVSVRYPSITNEDFTGPYAIRPLPKPQLGVPVIDGDKAYVDAIVKKSKWVTQGGRTVYFLTNTSNGWRIENALMFTDWPIVNVDMREDCKCDLLAPATPWQKAYLRKYEGFKNP